MQRYKIVIAYEGTMYSGWQIQPNAPSIQAEIERALQIFLKHPVRVIGSGRTDAGVHARGQVAHFVTDQVFEPRRLLYALIGLLPVDIRVKEIDVVASDFHAQISAKRKIYHYRVWQEMVMDPLIRRVVTHYPYPLDFEAIDQALSLFEGEHDFAAFANQGTVVSSTIRTLYRVSRHDEPGGFRIEFEGNGFLYKMVRNMMGLVFEIGAHKRQIDDIPMLLSKKDRTCCPAAAPATGLCLHEVIYSS